LATRASPSMQLIPLVTLILVARWSGDYLTT